MTRKLEVIRIGNTPTFNREGTIWQETESIIDLKDRVCHLHKKLINFDGDKRAFAAQEIEKMIEFHSFLDSRFDELYVSIWELLMAQYLAR